MYSRTDLQHKAHAPPSVRVHVVTVSDTRTLETDTSGVLIQNLLRSSGHCVVGYDIVRDEPDAIQRLLEHLVRSPDADAVILDGGTGISCRDTTYEIVSRLLDKRIDGFGELFRYLSFQEIGSAAMLSRAVAGVSRNTIVVSVPGSEDAVRLAMERLVIPELPHMVGLVKGNLPGQGACTCSGADKFAQ